MQAHDANGIYSISQFNCYTVRNDMAMEYSPVMIKILKMRLASLMKERGHNMKSLSLASRLSETYVREILKRDTIPTIRSLAALAAELNCPISYLLGEEGPFAPSIPILGYASAGEAWTPYDTLDEALEVDLTSKSLISIEIKGDSMSPVYRNGDFLICDRVDGAGVHNIVGHDCAVYTVDGEAYIKILNKGPTPTTYNLRSYNPIYPDIEDVKIKWAAPVVWIKRDNF